MCQVITTPYSTRTESTRPPRVIRGVVRRQQQEAGILCDLEHHAPGQLRIRQVERLGQHPFREFQRPPRTVFCHQIAEIAYRQAKPRLGMDHLPGGAVRQTQRCPQCFMPGGHVPQAVPQRTLVQSSPNPGAEGSGIDRCARLKLFE